MKKLFAALLVVLLCAGSAYAVDVSFSGSYYVRGSYISNDSALSADDTAAYMYYDQDFNLTTRWAVNDNTFVSMRAAMIDNDWGTSATADDDNIAIERLFGGHTFGNGGKLEAGLMTGAAWATAFGDNSGGKWRVKYTQPIPMGAIIGILEKTTESGKANATTKDAEDDDTDAYHLAGIFKAGDINILPLFSYVTIGDIIEDQDQDATMWSFVLGADGAHGAFGWEGEFQYKSTDFEDKVGAADDPSVYGLYLNGWFNYGAGKVGAQVAYGSWDDDAEVGYGMGEDFGDTIFLGSSWAGFGTSSGGLTEYSAVTMFILYANYAASDALSFDGRFAYGYSNEDDTVWEEATFWEVDAGLGYKISDAVKYSVAAGYAQIDQDENGVEDVDPAVRVYHKLAISF